jgi:hypothetical protein
MMSQWWVRRSRSAFVTYAARRLMSDSSISAAHSLLATGTFVRFRVVDAHTELSPDKENVFVRADLVFEGDDEDTDPAELVEWAAFGFLFTLAVLSSHDARPRGLSAADYQPNDEFTVADFFDCLSFNQGELHLRCDYVQGRGMKTEATIRQDGSVTLTTWGRGQSLRIDWTSFRASRGLRRYPRLTDLRHAVLIRPLPAPFSVHRTRRVALPQTCGALRPHPPNPT